MLLFALAALSAEAWPTPTPPRSFPLIALLLDATINIRGPERDEVVPAKEFFVNLFSTAVHARTSS